MSFPASLLLLLNRFRDPGTCQAFLVCSLWLSRRTGAIYQQRSRTDCQNRTEGPGVHPGVGAKAWRGWVVE